MITAAKEKRRVRYQKGYRYVKCPSHPYANSAGYVIEHRLIAEQYLINEYNSIVINGKRYLSPNFIVHHIDFNRLNNVPENLLVLNGNEHKSMHQKLYDKQYFLYYCEKFNLNPDVVEATRADFKIGNYKKYIL